MLYYCIYLFIIIFFIILLFSISLLVIIIIIIIMIIITSSSSSDLACLYESRDACAFCAPPPAPYLNNSTCYLKLPLEGHNIACITLLELPLLLPFHTCIRQPLVIHTPPFELLSPSPTPHIACKHYKYIVTLLLFMHYTI